MKEFKNINEFFDFKRKCFCGNLLKIEVATFPISMHDMCGELVEDNFIFLDNSGDYKININCNSSKIDFMFNKTLSERSFWLRLCCRNNNHNYFMDSDFLKLSDDKRYMLPFSLEYETIELGRYFVRNYFAKELCEIYINYNMKPIIIRNNVDFFTLNKDKILNKINTIINFL